MNLPQRHVAQVDQIGLVLCRHAKQFDSVKELRRKNTKPLINAVIKTRETQTFKNVTAIKSKKKKRQTDLS